MPVIATVPSDDYTHQYSISLSAPLTIAFAGGDDNVHKYIALRHPCLTDILP